MSKARKIDNFINNFFEDSLKVADKELYDSIEKEFSRQQQHLELIASENIVSKAVLEAQGSVLTNKYAEGYSGKRYYGGCEFVDISEEADAVAEWRPSMNLFDLIKSIPNFI